MHVWCLQREELAEFPSSESNWRLTLLTNGSANRYKTPCFLHQPHLHHLPACKESKSPACSTDLKTPILGEKRQHRLSVHDQTEKQRVYTGETGTEGVVYHGRKTAS